MCLYKLEKYPAYKESDVEWLGEIPSEWEVKKIKHISRIKSGDPIVNSELKDIGKYEVFGGNGLMGYCNKFNVENKNIIIGRVGAYCGNVKYSTTKRWISDNALILSLDKSEKYDFMYYLLNASKLNNLNSSNAQPLITGGKVLNFHIPYPPKQEQTKIAQFLDTKTQQLDRAIQQKEQLIELLKERRQILINDAVTKGIDDSVVMRDSGVEWIGEIPEGWEVKKLKYIFTFNKGLTITKENLVSNGIECVNYGEIHSKYGFELNPKIHKLKCVNNSYLKLNKKSLLNFGDFIFADTSEDIEGSGNFTYLNSDIETFAGYHTVIARSKIDINSRFFAYVFDSLTFRFQIRRMIKGVKVYSITQGLLKDIFIWFPLIDEQNKLVKYIDRKTSKIDKAITLQQEKITKLKEYKTTLIDSVVTGKVKVS